jgi:hypothetical protein
MKTIKGPSTPPVSPTATEGVSKPVPKKPVKDAAGAAEIGQKIDRPGFDLSGSDDDTHAGTGLGLGEDAFDTSGDRRLPGRRLDGKLTIPRWSGPGPYGTTAPVVKTTDTDTPPPKKEPR